MAGLLKTGNFRIASYSNVFTDRDLTAKFIPVMIFSLIFKDKPRQWSKTWWRFNN
jgi:hypothetical protein